MRARGGHRRRGRVRAPRHHLDGARLRRSVPRGVRRVLRRDVPRRPQACPRVRTTTPPQVRPAGALHGGTGRLELLSNGERHQRAALLESCQEEEALVVGESIRQHVEDGHTRGASRGDGEATRIIEVGFRISAHGHVKREVARVNGEQPTFFVRKAERAHIARVQLDALLIRIRHGEGGFKVAEPLIGKSAVIVERVPVALLRTLAEICQVAQPPVGDFDEFVGRLAARRRGCACNGDRSYGKLPFVVALLVRWAKLDGRDLARVVHNRVGERRSVRLAVREHRHRARLLGAFERVGGQHLVGAVVRVVQREGERTVSGFHYGAVERFRRCARLGIVRSEARGQAGGAVYHLGLEVGDVQLDGLRGYAAVLERHGDGERLPVEQVDDGGFGIVRGVFGNLALVRPEAEARRAVGDAGVVVRGDVDGGAHELREAQLALAVAHGAAHEVVAAVVLAGAARGGLPARQLAHARVVGVGRPVFERHAVQRPAREMRLHADDALSFHVEEAAREEAAHLVVVAPSEPVAQVAVECHGAALARCKGRAAVARVGAHRESAACCGLVERDGGGARERRGEGGDAGHRERAGHEAGGRGWRPAAGEGCGADGMAGGARDGPGTAPGRALGGHGSLRGRLAPGVLCRALLQGVADGALLELGGGFDVGLRRGVARAELVLVHGRAPRSILSALRARWRWERTVAGRSPVIRAISSVAYPS